ncbi:MAG: PemK-like, MazF-like toxin of type toxin-antitoxin system [Thermosipho sp. (in: thermotogales)]|jgi:mRNA-degrading endonuclease toxin of MazEF toxin-antitoxin module|nr:PemK-like, MazF-like toxin of type toxin-antitoxin system [Thermosipho sp. (in: thermotogales)]
MFGDIYSLDLTDHTNPSKLTLKNNHMVVVINRDFGKKFPLVNIVPITSFKKDKHWDSKNNRLKYFHNYKLEKSKYKNLNKDSIVDCAQIFTIDKTFLNKKYFSLNEEDKIEIKKRLAYVLDM